MIQGFIRTRSWCALAVLILSASAYADDWLPVTPEELQMTSEPKAPKAPAIILYRQVDRNDTVPDETIYMRIKVLTEEGRAYGDIEIAYDREDEKIRGLQARTIRPDGSIVNFEGTIYDKPLLKTSDSNMMAKSLSLPNVEVGTIIEYRYRHTMNPGWVYNSRWLLSQDLFTRRAAFSLIPSHDFTLRWSWPLGLPEGTKAPESIHGTVRLETQDVPAFVTEEFMPPEAVMKYRVEFVYEDEDSAQAQPEKYWKAFGKRANRRVSNFVGDPDDLKDAVATIVQPGDSPETKVRKIYAHVQQMRNLTYERQKTEQEIKREKINDIETAKEAWKRGYANRAHLTWLFLALVRAANVEANAVLIPQRDDYFFSSEQMNARQLNSNAVLVKLPDREVFLDPATAFTPFGLLPWEATAVQAFSLDKEGGKWVTTPVPKPEDSRMTRKLVAKLSTGGTLEGKLTVTYTGLEAAWRRKRERHADATELKKYLESDVEADVPVGIDVTLTNSPDWTSSESPLVAEFDFKVSGWASSAGKRALVPVGLFGGGDKHMFEHAARVHPIYFHFPFVHTDEIVIELPPGWKVASAPQPRSADVKAVKYSMSATPGAGTLTLKREITANFVLVLAKFYPNFRNFYQQVRSGDEDQAVVTP